jgi:hypothetical protein
MRILTLAVAFASIASAASAFPHSTPSATMTVDTSRAVGPVVIDRSVATTKNAKGQVLSIDTTRTVTNTNNGHTTTTTQDCETPTGSHIKVCN